MEKNTESFGMRRGVTATWAVFLAAFLSLSLWVYPSFASEKGQEPESRLDWILENMKKKEKSIKTFTAAFTQTKESTLLKDPLLTEGRIYFDHRGKMLFKVTHPFPLLVLLENGALTIHYPDLSETRERYLGRNFIETYFGVGQSVEKLQEAYVVHLMSEATAERCRLKLIPKSKAMARRIDVVVVTVSLQTWLPEEIMVREKGGDRMDTRLEFLSFNQPLPPDVFEIPKSEEDEGRF
jgi:outer membrane lipoprotein-sorting protein